MNATHAATIYSRPGCHQCVATIRAFQKAALTYTVVDLSDAPAHVSDNLRALGYTAAPVIITATGAHWAGFRPDRIAALATPAHDAPTPPAPPIAPPAA